MHTHLRRMQLFAITYYYHYRTPNGERRTTTTTRPPPTTNDRRPANARLLFGEFATGMACSSSWRARSFSGWLILQIRLQPQQHLSSVSRWAESEPEAAAKAEAEAKFFVVPRTEAPKCSESVS